MKNSRINTGLTLVELLIVLTILIVLTSIATQSLSGFADQSRFEATQKTLVNVQHAIVGNSGNSQEALTGFVADMGRLPTSLEELLVPPANASVYGLQPAPSPCEHVLVPRGWRGPYLRLPTGSLPLSMPEIRDGWGVPLVATQPTLTSFSVASPAANRSAGNAAYNIDLTFTISPSDWQATLITGTLHRGMTTTDIWNVTLYAPGAANVANGVEQHPATIATATNGDVSYSITTALSIGPRVLQALKNGTPYGNPVYITLRPGATHVVNFYHE